MTIGLPHKPHLGRTVRIGLASACALSLGMSLCACSSLVSPKIDPASPAAASVARIEHTDLPYPRWSQFPSAPQQVPTPAEFAARANGAEGDQAQLLDEASKLQWTLCCTEEWATQARSAIDPGLAVPAPADSDAQTDAFVKAMQAVATPPPPAPK